MHELRFAIRRLLKSPLQLAAGLLAFALGIGVNTAMFSLSEAILLKPLELKQIENLVVANTFVRGLDRGLYDVSPADFADLRAGSSSFTDMGLLKSWDATLTRDAEPEHLQAAQVTANWFDVLGSEILEGRSFRPGDNQPGNHRIAVISHGLWARRYGSDPKIIGRRIRINNVEHEVVGVVKQTARFPSYIQVYAPLSITPKWDQDRTHFEFMIVGRLKPGRSMATAQAEFDSMQATINSRFPDSHQGRAIQLVDLRTRVAGSNDLVPRYVIMLMLATGFALLIACANVANLQLARVTGRSREFAILSALGASRWQVARQALLESILLSFGGALLGSIAAIWCVDGVKRMLPSEIWQFIPMWPYVQVDTGAVLFTSALGIAAGLLSGLVPAFQTSREDPRESLQDGGRGATRGASRQRFRSLLVSSQMALALVLLIGAGLMVRSAQASIYRFSAKKPEQIATLQALLPGTVYDTQAKRVAFLNQIETELSRLPGASGYALVNNIPLSDNGYTSQYFVEGRPEPKIADRRRAVDTIVSPGYFQLMQIPLLAGRLIEPGDQPAREPVCVIDKILADREFPGQNPLGQRLVKVYADEREPCRIVGVVAPEVQFAWDYGPSSTLYRPMAQVGPWAVSVMVRSQGDVHAMVAAARKAVHNADPDQPVRQAFPYQELIENTLAGLRMVAVLMSGIGFVALLLACLGIYSVMSYIVTERTAEIGMRMALGAGPGDVGRLLGKQAFYMAGSGMAVGLILGFTLARLSSGIIFGISSSDFWGLSSVSILLALVSALAVYIPARRAIRMDPSIALRHD